MDVFLLALVDCVSRSAHVKCAVGTLFPQQDSTSLATCGFIAKSATRGSQVPKKLHSDQARRQSSLTSNFPSPTISVINLPIERSYDQLSCTCRTRQLPIATYPPSHHAGKSGPIHRPSHPPPCSYDTVKPLAIMFARFPYEGLITVNTLRQKLPCLLLATGLISTIGLTSPAASAQALASNTTKTENSVGLANSEESLLRAEMTARQIDIATQDKLLAKIRNGELPDADNPEAKPVSRKSSDEDGLRETLVFADGSVAITTIGAAHGEQATTSGVRTSECNRYWYNSGWERWDNCLIEYSGIAFRYGFRANISLPHKSSGRAIIRHASQPTVWRAVGHTVQNRNVRILQSWESKQNRSPARAQMIATLQVVKIFSTKSIALNLDIRGRSVSITPKM